MATRRDLVEAHAFGRRRLVTAFVSGAPGGREAEPARPGRAVLGGLALSVLLVAGAAVAGLLPGREPAGWDQPGLLISRDTGSLYVILESGEDPVLHPVLNLTSARLALGPGLHPTLLGEETIAAQHLGPEIGILGAPPTVPAPGSLIDSGWSACASDGGALAVTVSTRTGVRSSSDRGFTVRSGGRYFVIATGREEAGEPARAYSYALPDGVEPDPLLDALGLPITADAREVPERWLRLFPEGGALDFATLGLERYGEPAPDQGPGRLPRGARIGQLVTLDGSAFQVLTADGPADLDPFALAVYRATRPPTASPMEVLRLDAAPRVAGAVPAFTSAHWPDRLLREELGEHCALLAAEPGRRPVVLTATGPDEVASAAGADPGSVQVRVDPGSGAHVRVGGWDDATGGRELLVASTGVAHVLDDEAAARLGYAAHDAPLVPEPWVALFAPGVPLVTDQARCPPSPSSTDLPCPGTR